jgi:hypothetical protein
MFALPLCPLQTSILATRDDCEPKPIHQGEGQMCMREKN